MLSLDDAVTVLVVVVLDVLDEEDELLVEPVSAADIAFSVFVPATPSADRPLARWKAETEASVLLP